MDPDPSAPFGLLAIAPAQQYCANYLCNNIGRAPCPVCYLVVYCSNTCQSLDGGSHATKCHQTVLTKAEFEAKGRLPIWAPPNLYPELVKKHLSGAPQYYPQIGPKKSGRVRLEDKPINRFPMFGRYPAIDVLKLANNEGIERKEPLDILFVEPDDLRDVIKTIVDLPDAASCPINVYITDDNPTRTARNFLLILMAACSTDAGITAECAVHFWYNHFFPAWCPSALHYLVGDMVATCVPKNQEEVELMANTDYTRQFLPDAASVEVTMNTQVWEAELGESGNLDHDEMDKLRLPKGWRTSRRQYQLLTQLAPFNSHPENWPRVPNPGLIYDKFWPTETDVDPLRGWDLATIDQYNTVMIGAAYDIYGKMFYYVRDLFKQFILKVRAINITFSIMPFAGCKLPYEIDQTFDRIETGVLADPNLVGPSALLDNLSHMLKPETANPHAALITLFPEVFDRIQSVFPCPTCDPNRAQRIARAINLKPEEIRVLDTHLPERKDPVNWIFTATGWQRRDARWLLRDPADAWELYEEIFDLKAIGEKSKLVMRDTNTIVDQWVLRPKHAHQFDLWGMLTVQARMDFEYAMATGQFGGYRYVEWRVLKAWEQRPLVVEMKKAQKGERELPKHDPSHENLSEKDREKLKKAGERLETWMGEDNCRNWTPF
ncbi:hypothetical protein GGR51DRAFT_570002 [Nemania sp. FL0031]|nr:hypothetical protein GGR51DRAFT_570002 [Nemania sp. FL0031]